MFKILRSVPVFIFIFFQTTVDAGDSTYLDLKGNVYGIIFSSFHSQINSGNNNVAFEMKRVYFGYKCQLSNYFNANVKLDIGSPEDVSEFSRIRRYAYFKNAYINYKSEKLSAYFGIIDLMHFKLQEKAWAHRYIEKSFNDRYKFGNSADLGFLIKYRWNDWFSSDLTIENGEGYSSLQGDNTLKSSLGVTLFPWKKLLLRIYGDLTEKTTIESTFASFLAYKVENKLIAGVEYNYKFNEGNIFDHDMFGYSLFASYYPVEKIQIFGRFDKVSSQIPGDESIPWNLARDGSSVIAGMEYSPIKYLKIAVDYQDWFPWAENEANNQYIYLDLEVSF